MPSVPIQYPMINGIRFDFSSVLADVLGTNFGGFKSIDYSHMLSPGKIRGNRAQVVGRTRGKYDANASCEIWKAEFANLLALLGPGYMEVAFDIGVSFSEPTTPALTVTDKIVGCRIVKDQDQLAEGEEPATVKVDLDVMYVLRNGIIPVNPLQFFR